MARRGVGKSAEFNRIFSLPRRQWETEDIKELAEKLTNFLKVPGGTMELRQIQAVALKECYENGGLFGPIPVGFGKSLISFLAPTLQEAQRPLLLIPAKLRAKTKREMAEYAKHFRISDNIKVMSYEMLSRHAGQEELIEFAPDMIIADECHRLKNGKAACTKRVARWMKQNEETVFLGVSGTITRKSVMDYAHILKWALGDKAPIPTGWRECQEWSLALDENLPFRWERYEGGALLYFGTKEEQLAHISEKDSDSKLKLVRQAYGRRLTETPGVVAVQGTYVGSSLNVETTLFKQPEVVQEQFRVLRDTWQTPDGLDIMEAPVFWMYARQYACGFYYKWKHRPPTEWLAARKAWSSFVRSVITNNRRGLDTEYQVALAVSRGEYPNCAEYEIWKNIRETFKPEAEAVWLSDDLINHCIKWTQENTGIIWTEHVAFGRRLAKLSGLPYYGQQGLNAAGEAIEDASGSVIASIQSNGEGRNLQQWDNNLIVSCPPSAATLEQLMGRTHRHGQESEEVSFSILMKCMEDWEGFEKCVLQAKYVSNTTQQQQKILSTTIEYLDPKIIKKLTKSSDASWCK